MESEERVSLMSMCIYLNCVVIYIGTISSPYMFVIGDDNVIRYTGVNNVAGGAGDA